MILKFYDHQSQAWQFMDHVDRVVSYSGNLKIVLRGGGKTGVRITNSAGDEFTKDVHICCDEIPLIQGKVEALSAHLITVVIGGEDWRHILLPANSKAVYLLNDEGKTVERL